MKQRARIRDMLMLCACISAAPALLYAQDSDGLESFDDTGFDTSFETSAPAVTLNGNASVDMRAYVDPDTIDDVSNAVSALPSFTLDVGYSGTSSDVLVKLYADEDTVKRYPADIIKELTVRAYLGSFVFEAGKMNVVWGKGDKLHVLDNFNANDYTDFIIPDYLDRRIAEPMLRGIWNSDNGIRAEIVYTPLMTADRSAESGLWTPAAYTSLHDGVVQILGVQGTVALAGNDAAALLSIMNKADTVIPQTRTLEYGQAGARITGSAGVFDWGVSYYYGHYKQPSADMSSTLAVQAAKTQAYTQKRLSGGSETEAETAAKDAYVMAIIAAGDSALPSLSYDVLQVLGLEGAAALGMFNVRAEAAYYLTRDVDGDDPWVHNNSVQWLFGFDVDVPVHNININVQTVGKYILKYGSDGVFKTYDVDYDAADCATNNRIVVNVSDTFLHEKMKIECSVLWGIERGDILIMPKASYTINGALKMMLSGLYITGNDESEFAEWQNNSFVQIGAQYVF